MTENPKRPLAWLVEKSSETLHNNTNHKLFRGNSLNGIIIELKDLNG
jgi:hypothetical protein